jgi:hypothetical protein
MLWVASSCADAWVSAAGAQQGAGTEGLHTPLGGIGIGCNQEVPRGCLLDVQWRVTYRNVADTSQHNVLRDLGSSLCWHGIRGQPSAAAGPQRNLTSAASPEDPIISTFASLSLSWADSQHHNRAGPPILWMYASPFLHFHTPDTKLAVVNLGLIFRKGIGCHRCHCPVLATAACDGTSQPVVRCVEEVQ